MGRKRGVNINSQRERFLSNGIPYDDLDQEMIDLIDVLNFHLKLKTKFCCYGHDNVFNDRPYVIFDENVKDEEIYHLAEQVGKEWLDYKISFNKWVRYYPLFINWRMDLQRFKNPNSKSKEMFVRKIVQLLEKCVPYNRLNKN